MPKIKYPTFCQYCREMYRLQDRQIEINNEINETNELIDLKLKQINDEELYPSYGVAKYNDGNTMASGEISRPVENMADQHYHNARDLRQELHRLRRHISALTRERADNNRSIIPFDLAVRRLNQIDKTIVIMRYSISTGRQPSYEEIAEQVNLSVQQIKNRHENICQHFIKLFGLQN